MSLGYVILIICCVVLLIVMLVIGIIVCTKRVRKQKVHSPPKLEKRRRKRCTSSRKINPKAIYDVSLAGFGRAWAGRPHQELNYGHYIFDDSSSGYLSLQGSEAYHNGTHEDFACWFDWISFQNGDNGYLMPARDFNCSYVNVADLFSENTYGAAADIEEAIPIPEAVTSKSISSSAIVHLPLPSSQFSETEGEESDESADDIDYIVAPSYPEPSGMQENTNPRELTNPRVCSTLKKLIDNDGYITAV